MRRFFPGHDYDEAVPAAFFWPFCLFLIVFTFALCLADEIKRDASGNVIERDQSTATGVIVRDEQGKITGRKEIHRNSDGSKTVIVRDANGNITERKAESGK